MDSSVTVDDIVFLSLLARDAPAVEYDEPVRFAREAGASPERIAALDHARALALRVRTTIRDQRRRENELAALFETAGDLAGLRDLDDVLRAIVLRARKLLGTDVAYLSLHDEKAGDTYMRVTAGSVSAEFQRVRLGMGEGLGGLVAQTASPYATADYFNDDRFRHTRPIDSAVHDEGLVAILGVPLLAGGEVIGVLFASDRKVRPFTRDEVALLSSLATHAAIAIESANQLAETKAALAELAEASRVIREHSAAVERAAEAHETLTSLLLRGANLNELADSVSEILGGAVCLTDARGPDVDAATAESERTGKAVFAEREHLWIAAIQAGGELLGTLAVRADSTLDPADQRILERAAMVTAIRLLTERSVREAEYQVRGELLTDLLDAADRPDPDAAALRERARRLNADLDAAHVIVVAKAEDADRRRLASAAAHLAATKHGLAGERAGTIVLLIPGTDPTATARDVVHQLHAAIQRPVTAGAAGPGHGPLKPARLHAEAEHCLSALLALGRIGDAASAEDLGFVGLLLGGGQVPGFVERILGPVLDYDARRSTDLLRTLEAYFACGGNLMRAKDRLHVHVNTVTQRLDRIAKLLGPDWHSPDRALELQLALRLHRLR
ncbi:MAG TPA: GAF domain-containing protein [Actinospica sp.]|nr:GAF domain-containing protein [Actinospica sp.]